MSYLQQIGQPGCSKVQPWLKINLFGKFEKKSEKSDRRRKIKKIFAGKKVATPEEK